MKFKLQNNLSRVSVLLLIILCSANLTIIAKELPVLKDAFKNYFLIGIALKSSQFTDKDTLADAIVKKKFNSVSPENVLKWEHAHPWIGSYNFELPDSYVEFDEKYGMFINNSKAISRVTFWGVTYG